MKMSFGPLVVSLSNHEWMPGPFILSLSKGERAIFIASEAKQSRYFSLRLLRAHDPRKDN